VQIHCSPKEESKPSAEPSDDNEVAKLRKEAERLRLEAEALRAATQAKAALNKLKEGLQAEETEASSGSVAQTESKVVASESAPASLSQQLVNEASSTAATALLSSAKLRNAMQALLQYKEQPGGAVLLTALAERACSSLQTGEGSLDSVLGEDGWSSVEDSDGGILAAKEVTQEVLKFLSPGPDAEKEAKGACSAERRAVLDLIIYDELPDLYAVYGQFLEIEQDQGRKDQYSQEVTLLDPSLTNGLSKEQKEAALFSRRLEKVPSDTQRVQDRLTRLKEYPLAQALAQQVQEDPEWRELVDVLKPMELQIYNATRTAQLRERSPGEYQLGEVGVINLEFTLAEALGAIVVGLAALYIFVQALDYIF